MAGISRERWDANRAATYALAASIEQGHDFRVSDDGAWLVCLHCPERILNDGGHDYETWCPRYWNDNLTLKPIPDDFVPYPAQRAQ